MIQSELFFRVAFSCVSAVIFGTLLIGACLWIARLAGWTRRNLCGDSSIDLITSQPQPKPTWTAVEFLVFFGVLILFASLLQPPPADLPAALKTEASPEVLTGESSADKIADLAADARADESATGGVAENGETSARQKRRILAHTTANVVALGTTILFLHLLYGATLRSLSLLPRWRDLRIGLVATPWILMPVLGINLLVVQFVEYEHAVTNLLGEDADGATFAFLFASAAIVTPIAEEFQFRLLLQGGLQQLGEPAGEGDWEPRAFWPILVTSFLFAAMHFGQGAAPIPLFFLSIGLGLLYQRTGRLIPVIIVHMLLNGATLLTEFCRINGNVSG
ncbi:MAG: CPBP family intramembrane glutamic endopeptidase [Planctomycetota bacterium]